jgi:hypothetical protein
MKNLRRRHGPCAKCEIKNSRRIQNPRRCHGPCARLEMQHDPCPRLEIPNENELLCSAHGK